LDQAAIKPHRWHYWLNSPDPDFEAKMLEIVDLYLKALRLYERGQIVLSVDEKSGIQALERKAASLPTRPGRIERIEHEYVRHGTACLTAALEVATGQALGYLTPNRPAEVFAEFVRWMGDLYADARKLHIIVDNLNTHYHQHTCDVVAELCGRRLPTLETGRDRKAFLTSPHKWMVFHFTPSHGSWLNQIEIWFSTLTRQVIRRGNFHSPDDLMDKIIAFIEYYDAHLAHPYRWTYTGKPLAGLKHAA
jgi:transposase